MPFRPIFIFILASLISVFYGCGSENDASQNNTNHILAKGVELPSDQISPPKKYEGFIAEKITLEDPIVHRKTTKRHPFPEVGSINIESTGKTTIKAQNNPRTYTISSTPIKAAKPLITSATDWQENIGKSILYTAQNGVPTSNITALRQDNEGAIWGSSRYGGIWKFDGYTYTHYNNENGLIDNSVVDFWIDKENNIWIGGSSVLSMYDGSHFLHLTGDNEISQLKPTKFAEDSNGNMWIGSLEGLYKIDKSAGEITHFTTDQGLLNNEISSLLFDHNNQLWITYNGIGISRLTLSKADNQSIFEISNFPFHQKVAINNVQCILENKDGHLLIGTDQSLIVIDKKHQEEHNNLTVRRYKRGSFDVGFIFAMTEDKNGKIWIANSQAIACVIPDKEVNKFAIEYFDQNRTPLADQSCFSLVNDSADNIWIGHSQQKITKITQHTALESYLDDFDISLDVLNVLEDKYGNTWFLAKRNGLYCHTKDQGTGERILLNYKFAAGATQLTRDQNGNIWFAYQNLLYKIKPVSSGLLSEADIYGKIDQWPIKNISNLYFDRNDNLWISSNTIAYHDKILKSGGGGAYRFDGKDWYEYGTDQGLIFDQTHDIFVDDYDHVWIKSVDRGLTKFILSDGINGSQWTHFSSSDSLMGPLYRSIYFSNIIYGRFQNKPVHISSDPEDLSLLKIKTLPFLPEIYGQHRVQFHQRSEHEYWVSSNYGLEMVDRILENGNSEIQRQSFLTKNGYPLEIVGNLVRCNDDKILCPTKNNIYALKNSKIFQKTSEKEISTFSVFHRDTKLSDDQLLNLTHDQNYLRISYNSTAVNERRNLFYRYQLQGFDKVFSDPEISTTVSYPKLPHGQFTFKVQAKIGKGNWGPIYSKSINITPPWWQSWWAYLLYGISAISFLYGLWRTKTHQIEQQNKIEKEQIVSDQLRQLDKAKTEFFTNLSHEFRTPLTVILGMSEEIEKPKKAQTLIRQSGQNLLRLVNQMLDFSKMEDGKLKLHVEEGEFIAFAKYLFQSFESLAEHKKIELTFESQIEELTIEYDEEKIQHVISNILSNAIKFTPNGGSVHFSIEMEDDQLMLSLKDSGIGITEENLPYIFDRFFQGEEASTTGTPGTGIGLSFSKDLVELMNGEILIENIKPKGVEVRVMLPITKANISINNKPQIEAESPLQPISISQDYLSVTSESERSENDDSPLLLLIEDNPEVVSYISFILGDKYQLLIAEDGKIGIDMALKSIPDIIISDVMMPFKDGYQVTQTLKNDERTSHVPIILLTAKVDSASRMKGFERRADAYLAKPFNKEELMLRIDNMVEFRKSIQDRYQQINSKDQATDTSLLVEDVFIKKVNTLILENISNPNFVVDELAQKLIMSRSQLYRKLKALTNQTAVSYIRSFRLNVAMQSLKEGQLNVSEVAFQSGFSDPGYFTKVFSKEFGMLPSEVSK